MVAILYQPQCVKSQYMLIKTPTDKASANTMLISTNYIWSQHYKDLSRLMVLLPRDGAFDLGLAVSVPLPIVTGIFVLLWFQSRLT